MNTPGVLVLAVLGVAIAAYAQYRIPAHTRTRGQALFTRLLLVVVGIAFAFACLRFLPPLQGIDAVAVFLASFGVVHLPAACILALKSWGRREQRLH